ncbi:MAG: PAS domain S-box protein [Candidatus Moranbacteria bacterium]|nr:PAS domain S-box protein [Candidatus Moranbacteria bacterium]MBP7696027.1 PAS domain S-box protein [Candidatus Moranbacteria bacterium]
MGLRLKVLLIVSSILLVLFNTVSWFIDTRLMRGFVEAQREDASEEIRVVDGIIARDVENFRVQGLDWSRWDDTYDFMQTVDPEYIESNLNDETFDALGVNIALFLDRDNRVVFSKQVMTGQGSSVIPEPLIRFLAEDERFRIAVSAEQDFSGIVAYEGQPLLVMAQPIIMSDGTGEPRGRLYFGRMLDQVYLDEIGTMAGVSLMLDPYADGSIVQGEEVYIDIDQASHEVHASHVLADSSARPSFVLQARYPGQIIARGVAESALFMRAMIALSFVFVAFIVLLEEWLVLRRVLRLESEVNHIAEQKDAQARVTVTGRDEFASLGKDINAMLDMLQSMIERTKKSESQFDVLANIAPVMIWMTDENGQYTYLNQSARDFIGDTEGQNNWEERVFIEDKGIRKGLMSEAREAKRPFRLEYRFRGKGGEYGWVAESAVPYIASTGELVGYLGIVVDIHKEKSIQLETKAFTQELEEMNGLLMAREEKMLEMKEELRELRAKKS